MDPTADDPVLKTPNQVVAYNLKRARELRGWTQEQAAKELKRYGVDWKKAAYSAAETSYERETRQRRFDPDELVAFCRAFDVPLGWFFIPPATDPKTGRPVRVALPGGETAPVRMLVELVFPVADERSTEILSRYSDLIRQAPDAAPEVARQIAGWATPHFVAAINAADAQLAGIDAAGRRLAELSDELLAIREQVYGSVRKALEAEHDEEGRE